MADAWELVVHHTYSGPPGVIFDHAPMHQSHGQGVNLADADFTPDGASPGSGVVRLRAGTSMIRVPASPSLRPLGGIRIEMLCDRELMRNGGTLISGDSFEFHTGQGFFGGGFTQIDGGGSEFGEGGSEPRPLPDDPWLTGGLQYPPAGGPAEINGRVVARWDQWNGLLASTAGLVIGSDRTGGKGVTGRIDDLKIWRLHPHRIGSVFVERPVEPEVARCWAEWSRRLDEVIRADPHCWQTLTVLLPKALFVVVGQIAALPGIQRDYADLSARYHQLWSEGRLGEIPAVLADLIALLRGAGFNPAGVTQLQELLHSGCFASLVEQLPIDCDAAFTDMFSVSESF